PLTDTDGAGTRAATAVRRGERLVQVHVDDIETHVAGPYLAENSIQIGAVVVQQTAGSVHDLRDFLDVLLEHPQRRRVGEHDAGSLRADGGSQRPNVDIAIRIRGNFPYRAAAHHGSGRVRAVGGVRHQNFGTCAVTALIV